MSNGRQFKTINKRHIIASLISVLTVASGFTYSNAFATQSIMTANGAPACASCHTGGQFTKKEGQAGLAAFLASKIPNCVAPQVLNASKTACVTPTTPTPPCDSSQVLQNNVCVTPAPTACGNNEESESGGYDSNEHDSDDSHSSEHASDEHDKSNTHYSRYSRVVPTLSAPDKVSVHAGEALTLAVTAFDCDDRPIKIQASYLPKGAKIENSIDPDLHMPKAVITWASPVSKEGKNEKMVLKAVAVDSDGKKIESAPQTVLIEVLPMTQTQNNDQDQLIKSNTVASARFSAKSQQMEVTGQVAWVKNSRKDERQAIIANEIAVITDATTGTELGTATIGKNGKWRTSIATTEASAPCSIDVSFHGKTGVKSVKGVKHCKNMN